MPADSTGESVAVFPVRDWDEEAVTAGQIGDDGAIHRATGAKLQTVKNVSILLRCCLVSFYLPLVTVHTEGCALLRLLCCAVHRIYCRILSSLVADTEQWVTSPGPCLAEGSGIAGSH